MYEATQIYALASGYDCKGLVDQRNANPFKAGKCTHHEVHHSSHFRELLPRNRTILPTLTLKVPAVARGEPEVVELGDNEERTEPEDSGSSRRQEICPPAQIRGSLPKRSRSCSSRQEGSRGQGATSPGGRGGSPLSGLPAALPSGQRAAPPSGLPAALWNSQEAAPPNSRRAALRSHQWTAPPSGPKAALQRRRTATLLPDARLEALLITLPPPPLLSPWRLGNQL
jgi:hypothetical protein